MAPLLELAIRRLADGTLTADLRVFQRNSITLLAPAQPVNIAPRRCAASAPSLMTMGRP
jgi:hypothetical protein